MAALIKPRRKQLASRAQGGPQTTFACRKEATQAPKRVKDGTHHPDEDQAEGRAEFNMVSPPPTWSGFVTHVISTRSPEAKTTEAQAAMKAGVRNIVPKGALNPEAVCDWHVVRQQNSEALI